MSDPSREDPKLVLLLREQNELLRESLSRQDKSEVRMEAMQSDIAEIKKTMRLDRHGERISVLESSIEGVKFWIRATGVAVIGALVTAVFALFRHGGKP